MMVHFDIGLWDEDDKKIKNKIILHVCHILYVKIDIQQIIENAKSQHFLEDRSFDYSEETQQQKHIQKIRDLGYS